jgi:hypothetical protein
VLAEKSSAHRGRKRVRPDAQEILIRKVTSRPLLHVARISQTTSARAFSVSLVAIGQDGYGPINSRVRWIHLGADTRRERIDTT